MLWNTTSLAVFLIAVAVASTASSDAINIGSRLELFTDDHLIGAMSGVELRLNHPLRCETARAGSVELL